MEDQENEDRKQRAEEMDAALWDAAEESADSPAAPLWADDSLASASTSQITSASIEPLLSRLRSSLQLLTVVDPGLEDLLHTLVEAVHTLAARDSEPAKPVGSPEPRCASPLPLTSEALVTAQSDEPAPLTAAELPAETVEALEDAAELVALLDDESAAVASEACPVC